MSVCPYCQHKEIAGALFCSECGAQLSYAEETPTKTNSYGEDNQAAEPLSISWAPPPIPIIDVTISLKILENGPVLLLNEGDEYTLGRVSGDQPILPDIDLTPYHAYEEGVSRLHATIKITQQMITITDLGSANGTRINGKKIPAHTPVPLQNGDVLTLGKFKLQVVFNSKS